MVARIELEPSGDYYMGTIANDAMGYGEIKVHNRGKLPLEVKEIKTTCACTQGQMLTNPVPPGETGILKVGVNPWRVPDFESTKTLTLDTNDPQNAQISIEVRADIDPEFEVVPRNPDFGRIQKGERSTVTVVMRQLGEQQVTLQRVRVGGQRPWVEVAFEERPAELWSNPNHVEYEIRITLTEDAPLGPVRVPYIIDSTCPRVRQLRCAAEGEVVSFYRLSRNQLYLGTYEVGSQIPEALVVSSDKPLTISDATVSLEGLGVTVKPGQEPNSQVFEFSVDSVGRGKHVGDLRFSVSNGLRSGGTFAI